MGMMGGGGGGAAPQQQQAAAAAEGGAEPEKKEEEVKEKTHFDVELTSFDAATKIKLIKEVRGALGLGLKEAKEKVESSPTWLMKDLAKEDAEDLKKKLEDLGASIRLA